ncbi:MAG: TlyA family RNA methyltransferase [Clostridia bacterium]|nr:TlyA family RNA methyltransferase [Clostridia bacterium]
MESEKLRLDVALTKAGLAAGRERAQGLIDAGLVTVNGTVITKRAYKVAETDELRVTGEACPYVSRGGFKLAHALQVFGVDATDAVCIDVGASTGGFTDVLLKNGARMVYAVDVGEGQLDESLQNDGRVVSMEHVNARELKAEMFEPIPTLAVMDVSFISIKLILPALFETMGENGRLVTLVKPQFEAGPKALGKKGIVNDPKAHEAVLESLLDFVPTIGKRVKALTISPIHGTGGNIEFLADVVSDRNVIQPDKKAVKALVKEANNKKA